MSIAKRTEPNWAAMIRSPDQSAQLRGYANKHRAQRMRAEGEASCIEAAGGDPNMPRGPARKKLIEAGRAIKARAKAAKQAHVKRLHHVRLKEAMPPWADKEAIQAIYDEARRMTAETGVPHEVDHIVPLLGVGVVGLHWEGNMRVVTRTENRRKSNR